MLCRSRIMKRFNIFYGGTKVKGKRDASFRRAENTEGARGDSCPPPQVFDTSVNPVSTRVEEEIVPTILLVATRPDFQTLLRPCSSFAKPMRCHRLQE